MTTIALIPARNEAARIQATVAAAKSVAGIDRVLVIDDASLDDTAALAGAAGAEVLRLPLNAGKGGALNAGLHEAAGADIVVLLDADLGGTATEASALLTPVLSGEADMTIGVLPRPARRGGFGLVKGLARHGIRVLSGFSASAPLSGQRALSRAAIQAGTPFAAGYGVEVALTVRVKRAELTVLEVPVSMTHAETGRDVAGFLHRGSQFASVARTLVQLAFER